jgi:hypothetical protein
VTQRANSVREVLPEFLPEVLSVHLILDVMGQRAAFVANAGEIAESFECRLARCFG